MVSTPYLEEFDPSLLSNLNYEEFTIDLYRRWAMVYKLNKDGIKKLLCRCRGVVARLIVIASWAPHLVFQLLEVTDKINYIIDANYAKNLTVIGADGTVCKFHVKDIDAGDSIKVTPANDITARYFNIVPNEGGNDFWVHVTVNETLDREVIGDIVKMKFFIMDINPEKKEEQNKIDYRFTLYIIDVNDNAPVFADEPYNLKLFELPCNNKSTVYSDISATDRDKGANGKVRFSMHPEAQDSGQPPRSSSAEFIIRVKDVQDMPPFFTGDPYRKSIKEGVNVGYVVITVNARDGDPGVSNNVSYSMTTSSCKGLFQINNVTGTISTSSLIDRDQPPINITGNCILTVEANEIETTNKTNYGITTTSTNVTVTVQDIDDNPPDISESSYYATVAENTPEDVPIKLNTTIVVTDIDQID
ncbi:protocadherin Fat 4-like [Mercenaria mercenaria]|uniref:protocadherin Fat 4-like n=1 Tax=Mercenaria mercenaria TaxID=6596 RepID=UPI00234E86C9|nr:protocadherin Fat 4-like [Mercenaria mercenaria]